MIPVEKCQESIRDHHDPPTCDHLGKANILTRINQQYYWKKSNVGVTRYIV